MDERSGEVESLVIDARFWNGRKVFLTGHTGFKGGWLTLVMRLLGAEVHGFALPPEKPEGIFGAAGVAGDVHHVIGDIRDAAALAKALREASPEVVIHMAAQPLVRLSYTEPVETYATNVMGTVNLLEAVRQEPDVRAVVVVTSDKCYENVGWPWGYRETDPLGGHDPYSNSKACAELVASAYRRSFFQEGHGASLGSVRAGNVIGGGDWAKDRLVPDAMRAFAANQPLLIRNPEAVRPWQHVLDPLIGYMVLIEHLAHQGAPFADAWNFGPRAASEVSVKTVVEGLAARWAGCAGWRRDHGEIHPHEAAYLRLDCSKAHLRLGWQPLIPLEEALQLTVDWYAALRAGANMRQVSSAQIRQVLKGSCIEL
ncbi:CDP-glucose 4,6-dehydratase [Bradyrhizobium sp. GM5.1]